ncbi:hypothetical protein HAX54_019059, partial [Datura stramonium]|nr:hypothetical protein [Datura stramonium]
MMVCGMLTGRNWFRDGGEERRELKVRVKGGDVVAASGWWLFFRSAAREKKRGERYSSGGGWFGVVRVREEGREEGERGNFAGVSPEKR